MEGEGEGASLWAVPGQASPPGRRAAGRRTACLFTAGIPLGQASSCPERAVPRLVACNERRDELLLSQAVFRSESGIQPFREPQESRLQVHDVETTSIYSRGLRGGSQFKGCGGAELAAVAVPPMAGVTECVDRLCWVDFDQATKRSRWPQPTHSLSHATHTLSPLQAVTTQVRPSKPRRLSRKHGVSAPGSGSCELPPVPSPLSPACRLTTASQGPTALAEQSHAQDPDACGRLCGGLRGEVDSGLPRWVVGSLPATCTAEQLAAAAAVLTTRRPPFPPCRCPPGHGAFPGPANDWLPGGRGHWPPRGGRLECRRRMGQAGRGRRCRRCRRPAAAAGCTATPG